MARIALVLNPVAGGGDAGRLVPRLVGTLGEPADLWVTEAAGDAVRFAERAVEEGVDRLVVAGGDGTVREAAEGVLRARGRGRPFPVLGIVPFGNANVLARELRLPREPARALDLALHGKARPFDVGRADGRPFLCMVGVGIDARVAARVDRVRRPPLGRLLYRFAADVLYAGSALVEIARGPGPLVTLHAEGLEPLRIQSLVAANTASYARSGRLGRDVRPDDGMLDLFVPAERSRTSALRFLAALALGGRVEALASVAGFRLEAERPFRVQVDGDPLGARERLEVGIEPSALDVVGADPPEPP